MKKITKIILIIIIVLASFLRLFQLDSIPPSLSWDETSAGYNAWTIANYGRDEWNQVMPLVFRSFNVDMNPVWIYAIAISTKILGLNEFSTRLPSALFGIINVLLLFFLGKLLFDSELIGLLAAFSLAVSPFNIQFSRGAWEANSALLFFLLGFYFFMKVMKNKELVMNKKIIYFSLSMASFGIDMFTYPSAKIVGSLMLICLYIIYSKELIKNLKPTLIGMVIFGAFCLVIILNPRLLGSARYGQAELSDNIIQATPLYKQTNNMVLGFLDEAWIQYKLVMSPQFLFISGDKNSKLSVQVVGEFYKLDLPFILLGLLFLLKKRSKLTISLLLWILFAPIPSAITSEAPHAHRSLFLMGSITLLIALGIGELLLLIKKIKLRIFALIIYLGMMFIPIQNYLVYYFTKYSIDNGITWQYGYKQVVDYVKTHPYYDRVYMTNVRAQPYIFFLYYLKYPLPEFRKTVVYNTTGIQGQSMVDSFGKFHFNDWNPLRCPVDPLVLCAVSVNEYDGEVSKQSFFVNEIVKFPNGDPAFYIISAYE